MFVITYRKYFYLCATLLTVGAVLAMVMLGFNIGIDFAGGTITEVSYPNGRPEKTVIDEALKGTGLHGYLLQPIGTDGYVVRIKELSVDDKALLMKALSNNGAATVKEERSSTIGPVVGNELKQKAYIAITLVILLIVLFVTFAFRKVSEPVASWKFGLATIIALAHDVIIPAGAFVIFSHYFNGEIDMLFVSALLAILGFSVHDTIVVFDRVREHLRINKEHNIRETFDITVGKSVAETFGRSISTSVTIFIVLVALYFFGPETTRNFTFTLIIGIVAGTYSSIFIATPLLVTFEKMQSKKKR